MQKTTTTVSEQSLAERLVELWHNADPPPRLDDFVKQFGPVNAGELRDLVAMEIDQRWKRGEHACAEEYLAAYPEIARDPTMAFDFIYAEIRARTAHTGYVDFSSFLQRFPEQRTRLEKQLEINDWLGGNVSSTLQEGEWGAAADPWKAPEIPDYRIHGELGRGGMAVVFKAEQLSLGRMVALKMVLPHRLSGEGDVSRFVAEAELTARLDHAHIVPIYDVGRVGNTPYFTMKLIDGPTLEKAQPQLKHDPRRTAGLMIDIAEGVHHAHQRGILHRDLKPANVLVNGKGEPSIVDFGLAKLLDLSKQLTASQSLIGTPCYLSPEQALPRGREAVTVTTDVYGLGGILYFLMTGQPPFEGATVLETLDKLRREEPIPPRRINPRVPRDIELICLKALEKSPSRRYTTAQEFADDLRRYLNHQPTVARPVSSVERVVRWAIRRPAWATVLLLVALGLIAAPTALWLHNRRLNTLNEHLAGAVGKATSSQQRAELSETAMRRMLHAADMKLAWQAWKEGGLRQFSQIMTRYHDAGNEEVRGAAWRFLAQLETPRPIAERIFDDESLYSAIFSPDKRYVLTAGKRSIVWAVDATQGQLCWSLSTEQKRINSISFSPDKKLLITAGDDGTVRLWDAMTRAPIRSIQAFANKPCYAAMISRNENVLATCGQANEVFLFDPATGDRLASLQGHSDSVDMIALSPAGNFLATAGHDGLVKVWQVKTRKLVRTWGPFSRRVSCVQFLGTDGILAIGCLDNHVRIVETRSPKIILDETHLDEVRCVANFTGRRGIVAGDIAGTLRFWIPSSAPRAAEHLRHIQGWQAHEGRILSVDYAGDRIASADTDGVVRIWHVPEKSWQQMVMVEQDVGIQFCCIPRSTLCAVAWPNKVEIRDLSTGFLVHQWSDNHADWDEIAVSPDGNRLALCGRAGRIEIYNVHNWQIERAWESGFDGGVSYLDWSAESEFLVVGKSTIDDSLRIFRTATGERVDALPAAQYRLARFSNRGHLLAVTRDNDIELWDVAECSKKATLRGHKSTPEAITFDSDHRRLASAGQDRRVFVWDIASGVPTSTLEHDSSVEFVAFSPDGRSLYSADSRSFLYFWTLGDEQPELTVGPTGLGLHRGSLSGDGRHLVLYEHAGILRAIGLGH